MLLLRTPEVYPPQADTWLLTAALQREPLGAGSRVLDLCSGSGALAVAAARHGADAVTAVDVSRQALAATWLNARCRGRRVRVRRGDLIAPVTDEGFDLVVSNPPYVPAVDDHLPRRGLARCWNGGVDGRAVLDRVCAEAPKVLAPGGRLLLVHSALCGVRASLAALTTAGLDVDVAARCEQAFGPVLRARAGLLESRGFCRRGARTEELVVLRAVKPR